MGKQIFDRIKKTMAVSLLVLFVMSVTAASVSASQAEVGQKILGANASVNASQAEVGQKILGANASVNASLAEVCFLKARFIGYPTWGHAPLKVKFTDKSIGKPTSWYWSFGDGTFSTKQNPVKVYPHAGQYTVRLTVKKTIAGHTCHDTLKIGKYIHVFPKK